MTILEYGPYCRFGRLKRKPVRIGMFAIGLSGKLILSCSIGMKSSAAARAVLVGKGALSAGPLTASCCLILQGSEHYLQAAVWLHRPRLNQSFRRQPAERRVKGSMSARRAADVVEVSCQMRASRRREGGPPGMQKRRRKPDVNAWLMLHDMALDSSRQLSKW